MINILQKEKYIVHKNKYFRETQTPKSLKRQYELINNQKVPKNKTVILTENNILSLTDKI